MQKVLTITIETHRLLDRQKFPIHADSKEVENGKNKGAFDGTNNRMWAGSKNILKYTIK